MCVSECETSPFNSECLRGQKCVNKVCMACEEEGDCGAGQACMNGTHVGGNFCSPCKADSDW